MIAKDGNSKNLGSMSQTSAKDVNINLRSKYVSKSNPEDGQLK